MPAAATTTTRKPVPRIPASKTAPPAKKAAAPKPVAKKTATARRRTSKPTPGNAPVRKTTACPACGESILQVAVKCKHCGEFLNESAKPVAAAETVTAAPTPPPPIPTKPLGNSPRIVCPHCGKTGDVDTARVKMKKGLSGGKATAAVLTAGISILGTGLSRKEKVTQAECHNCKVTWVMG